MKIISLVPSLTETFIELGHDVLGRTRYCIHPSEKIKKIPIVGGTKDVDWEKCKDLKPDLVVFDKEENRKEMAESCPFPFYASHITDLKTQQMAFEELAEKLNCDGFQNLARRVSNIRTKAKINVSLPVLEPILSDFKKGGFSFLYLIWKNPWMAVSRKTFIGDVLSHLGFEVPTLEKNYPEISLEAYSKEKTFLLFSSEPFPFGKKVDELKTLGFPSAVVDGELLSWYGIRSVRFLEGEYERVPS